MDFVLALKVFAVATVVLVGGEIAGHIGASVPKDDRSTSYRAIAAAALQVAVINALVIAAVLICSPSG